MCYRFFATAYPKSKSEYNELINRPIELPKNPKLNQIAILGAPNAGKSSLVNAIIGFNVCGESKKVHTTRHSVRGVYTEKNVQIELTDTPGCVTSKHAIKQKLEPNFLKDPDYSCNYANIIAILYDCSYRYEPQIIKPLLKILYKHRDKKSILILTKTDLVKDFVKKQFIQDRLTGQDSSKPKIEQFGSKRSLERAHMEKLFKLTEEKTVKEDPNYYEKIKPIEEDQKHWPYFDEVFQTSAFDLSGIEELKNYFLKTAYPNPWLYNEQFITDSNPNKVVCEIIKSKILDNVQGPTPYNIKIKIVDWIVNDNSIEIIANGKAENDYFVRRIIGFKGKIITRINNEVMEALSNLYKCEVNFRLDLEHQQLQEIEKKKNKNSVKKKHKDLI